MTWCQSIELTFRVVRALPNTSSSGPASRICSVITVDALPLLGTIAAKYCIINFVDSENMKKSIDKDCGNKCSGCRTKMMSKIVQELGVPVLRGYMPLKHTVGVCSFQANTIPWRKIVCKILFSINILYNQQQNKWNKTTVRVSMVQNRNAYRPQHSV